MEKIVVAALAKTLHVINIEVNSGFKHLAKIRSKKGVLFRWFSGNKRRW